jgi:acyl-CoA dehydrogenase
MRLIGRTERAIELMCDRAMNRRTFGKPLSERTVTMERIAESRIAADAARWMVMHAAWKLDKGGNKLARKEIAMIKVLTANTACKVIDWAIQVHGSYGFTNDFALAHAYAYARTQRIADGPDEIHRNQIAKLELDARRMKHDSSAAALVA